MENKLSKIIIGLLLVFLAAGGAIIWYQWRTINLFKNQIISGGQSNSQSLSGTPESGPVYMVEAVQQTLSDNTKDISGGVTAVSGKVLTVEAEIVDFRKLKDLTEDELSKPAETLPKTKKSYQVTAGDKTEFAGKKPEMISAGDSIKVFADELVYKSDNLTAMKIICPLHGENALLTNPDPSTIQFVAGRVKQISGSILTVEASMVDYSKVKDIKNIDPKSVAVTKKDYKITVNEKTEFINKKLEEIKIDDDIQAFSDKPVRDVSEFMAAKIVFLTPPEAPK